MPHRSFRHILILAVCAAAMPAVHANDPPDSAVNPVTGFIQTVDSALHNGDRNVRHVTDPGVGQPSELVHLTNHSDDDLDPRIMIGSNGDTWVVWWRDGATDEVLFRKLPSGTGSWDAERRLSEADESSCMPDVADTGTERWAAFEYDNGTDTSIGVVKILDDPDPLGIRTELGSTGYSGNRDVLAHTAPGNLWVTWIDSATEVGWSEYDAASDSWGAAQFESYAADTPADARERIRTTVLGN